MGKYVLIGYLVPLERSNCVAIRDKWRYKNVFENLCKMIWKMVTCAKCGGCLEGQHLEFANFQMFEKEVKDVLWWAGTTLGGLTGPSGFFYF
jgi:hypothetical protein